MVSAGGIISAVTRELHGATAEDADRQVRDIGRRLTEILTRAGIDRVSPWVQARRQGQERLTRPR